VTWPLESRVSPGTLGAITRGTMSSLSPRFDLSVVLLFGDDEEIIGSALRQLVTAVRATGLLFEIIAVDEDSGDNSHAVLAMLRPEIPELRVTHAPIRTRGLETGVARAQGRVIAVIAPGAVTRLDTDLAVFVDAIDRTGEGTADIELVLGSWLVAHRVRTLDAFVRARLGTLALQRRFAKRQAMRGLRVVVDGAPLERPVARPLFAFSARRAS
jgi:hypothetical protein